MRNALGVQLTQERLKELLHYDESTGLFVRLIGSGGSKAGDVAGYLCQNGYAYVRVAGYTFLAHRLAWFYVHGVTPPYEIDHINGKKSDNRLCNLRLSTKSENMCNQTKYANNTTGYKGVTFRKKEGRYQAQIRLNGKPRYLGLFSNPQDAHAAYAAAAKELHGQFARTA
jgi:hypothetical protein